MINRLTLIAAIIFLGGCAFVPKPSLEDMAKLDNPPPDLSLKINSLSQKAEIWIKDVKRYYTDKGDKLSDDERIYAKSIGVKNPDSVRLVVTETFPVPADEELKAAMDDFGMGGRFEGGRAMDHIIFLKPDFANSTTVITHELNHVAQFDRLGFSGMVKRYVTELVMLGYLRSPLEHEAYEKQVDTLPIN